ncbi:MAG: 30S ribosomal protein S16 [Bacteroidetes bacterium]|nr:30S ribosomal protein S16 [Bacteroidales bacterium]MBU1010814.1 30S ribosomal protein S16 [Bacteroidota bacterium]
MPARIRLQRFGKKGKPFYHIVIADGRAPRDGRFIEKIGTYNPITNPAEINIDFDKAVTWLQNGAQPSDTVKAILSYKGVLYKSHLIKGVKKGAMTDAQAEVKFQAWLQEKEAKIEAKKKSLEDGARGTRKERLEAEAKVKEARAAELAKKRAAELKAELHETEEAAEAPAEGTAEE